MGKSTPDTLWSQEEGLVFKVVHEGWETSPEWENCNAEWVSVWKHHTVCFMKDYRAVSCLMSLLVVPPCVTVCFHCTCPPLVPVLAVSWCGWHRESSLQLLVPARSWLGRAASAWGPSRTATDRALSAPRITEISSGSGPACSHTHTFRHTLMHAWYARMLRESVQSWIKCMIKMLYSRLSLFAASNYVYIFTMQCLWSKVGWTLCGIRGGQTATVAKVLCVCIDACVCVSVAEEVRGQDFTRFVTSGQQNNIRESWFLLLCTSLFILSKGSHSGFMVVTSWLVVFSDYSGMPL